MTIEDRISRLEAAVDSLILRLNESACDRMHVSDLPRMVDAYERRLVVMHPDHDAEITELMKAGWVINGANNWKIGDTVEWKRVKPFEVQS
jgi:hypothetical protein